MPCSRSRLPVDVVVAVVERVVELGAELHVEPLRQLERLGNNEVEVPVSRSAVGIAVALRQSADAVHAVSVVEVLAVRNRQRVARVDRNTGGRVDRQRQVVEHVRRHCRASCCRRLRSDSSAGSESSAGTCSQTAPSWCNRRSSTAGPNGCSGWARSSSHREPDAPPRCSSCCPTECSRCRSGRSGSGCRSPRCPCPGWRCTDPGSPARNCWQYPSEKADDRLSIACDHV